MKERLFHRPILASYIFHTNAWSSIMHHEDGALTWFVPHRLHWICRVNEFGRHLPHCISTIVLECKKRWRCNPHHCWTATGHIRQCVCQANLCNFFSHVAHYTFYITFIYFLIAFWCCVTLLVLFSNSVVLTRNIS